ncbi:hypothetical protein CIW47_20670 [Mycolicibacterium sp. P1-5]|nr:hypothetical protein CIW47_20670 [Mycolicibacterium sp. P1-5]
MVAHMNKTRDCLLGTEVEFFPPRADTSVRVRSDLRAWMRHELARHLVIHLQVLVRCNLV